MPQKSAPELFAVVHYLHRLSTEGKRGAKMALESCPKCHFIMLEGVLMTIEEHGQNGTIYVSDLAAAVKQPLPAVSRALRQLEQELHKAERTVRQAAPRKSHASGKEKASGGIFMAVFIVAFLSALLPSMIRSCQAKIDEGGHRVTVTPAQEEIPAEPAEVYYLSQGESFQWYGETAWV